MTMRRYNLTGAATQIDGSTLLMVGGLDSSNVVQDRIDRQSFSEYEIATDHGNLVKAMQRAASFASSTDVYRGGGLDGSSVYQNTVGKINPEVASNEAVCCYLGATMTGMAGHHDSRAGYFMCGLNVFALQTVLQRVDFVDDSIDTTYSNMYSSAQRGAGGGNENRLVFSGGQVGATTYSNMIQSLDLADGATAFQSGDLDVGKQDHAGSSSQSTMFHHQGALSFQNETNKIAKHEIDISENSVLFDSLAGAALFQGLGAYGGSP